MAAHSDVGRQSSCLSREVVFLACLRRQKRPGQMAKGSLVAAGNGYPVPMRPGGGSRAPETSRPWWGSNLRPWDYAVGGRSFEPLGYLPPSALWHCACLPTGSPLEPSSGAALVEVRRSTVQRAANNGAKKVQHRIESGPSGSPVEPSCGTSLSTPDLNATPSQQKWLSELPDHAPHLEPLSAVSIVTDACGDKRKTELHQAQ